MGRRAAPCAVLEELRHCLRYMAKRSPPSFVAATTRPRLPRLILSRLLQMAARLRHSFGKEFNILTAFAAVH